VGRTIIGHAASEAIEAADEAVGIDAQARWIRLIGWGAESTRKVTMFKHNCYYYGDGANTISFTGEFFESFRNKGFSVNSLCLALQSPLAFDPETGRRVPSYQVVHPRILAGHNPSEVGVIQMDGRVAPVGKSDADRTELIRAQSSLK
jgi:hypothetical protein